MKREIHLLPAEGGEDAKLFVTDLKKVFQKLAINNDWNFD